MGRSLRHAAGGWVYHVLNRANGRLRLFQKDGDYAAFERVLAEAVRRLPVPVLAYCVMPNHWHLVLWPQADGDLSRFVGWLTLTHTQRWHAHYHTAGSGHVYQDRFKKVATMLQSAPPGALSKRGRADPVHDPDPLGADLDALDQRADDLPPRVPVRLP